LLEYKEILRRKKFALSEELVDRWSTMLDLLTTVIDIDAIIDFPRDRKDAKFLECFFLHAQKLMNYED
jgi:hypothetical protein